jgi:hypothetical protein
VVLVTELRPTWYVVLSSVPADPSCPPDIRQAALDAIAYVDELRRQHAELRAERDTWAAKAVMAIGGQP